MSDTSAKKLDDLAAVQNAINLMEGNDQVIGVKLHELITKTAPELLPRTWYGMPSYSNGNKIVFFFRPGKRFGEHYVTLGFNDVAKLDDGQMWPTNYAITELTPAVEASVVGLIKKALGNE